MKMETLGSGETILLIPKHSQEEYPNETVPVVVLKGYSDRYNSEVKEIYRGPLFGGNVARVTGCASAGYLAMAVRDTTPGNVYSWLTKAIKSQDHDGLAAKAEAIKTCGFQDVHEDLRNICQIVLRSGVIAKVRYNFIDKIGLKRLEYCLMTIATEGRRA